MSKKQGAKRKRRKAQARAKRKPPPSTSPASLLAAVADALNACEQAGMRMRLGRGAAWCYHGVVLPPVKKRPWEARTFGGPPEDAPPEAPDDLDD